MITSGFTTSSRGVYLWIKYLKTITHYSDEDGWLNETEEVGKWTYKNIIKMMHSRFGSSYGDGNVIFDELKVHPLFGKIIEQRNIVLVDQLDFYAREWANHTRYRRK
jgi:hypothetical protein